ncbi:MULTISPECIES: hypothetical protein [Bacillus]|uniref:Uncharacterized protein n=1 Tax=Bacillus subtilis TaxID=1423 RepID=A0AAQ3ESK9_BACIU|nr:MULTISPECIES: hypothetical protein [Bacillus]KIN34391.1 hypothetical protein B4071_2087 [Bacillus subtilis]MBO3767130.1 hypothetical protein [Bacillus subtilis]MDP8528081.1 hypothetical protein [Bacillus subtilis]ODV46611.1 hypothetical protein BCM26_14665 [Bacillus subtilis]UNL87729.1 hypothetical protein IE382_11350 [Bacillus subtilis]
MDIRDIQKTVGDAINDIRNRGLYIEVIQFRGDVWDAVIKESESLGVHVPENQEFAGFMTKLKLPYYNFWKQMRGLKHKISNKHEHTVNCGSLYTPLHNRFFAWAKTKDRGYLKSTSIIKLRNDFEKETVVLKAK